MSDRVHRYNLSMPELPEVESVRRSLMPGLLGRPITRVTVLRRDIITGKSTAAALLARRQVTDIRRHGKQLALVTEEGPAVCVHLGMTGQLRYAQSPGTHASLPRNYAKQVDSKSYPQNPVQRKNNRPQASAASAQSADLPPHTHVIWHLEGGSQVIFVDPRRFGGLWTFPDIQTLYHTRWFNLGPDALKITPKQLHDRLQNTQRAVKAALLDQQLVAGLGNIYVDELLYACRIHPLTPGWGISSSQCRKLVPTMRRLLTSAIQAGGSTVRDYVDSSGKSGGYQRQHLVYGKSRQPCNRCQQPLMSLIVAGRTTVACNQCQPRTTAG